MNGAGNGATIGAASGAAIGAIFGKAKGATIGALSGGLLGAVIGSYYDKKMSSRSEAAKKYQYKASEEKLEIEKSVIAPQEVAPGTKFAANVQYTVLHPEETRQANIVETRLIDTGQEKIKLSQRTVTVEQGTHLSTANVTLPKDWPSGEYSLITVISDGKQQKTIKTPLTVV